MVILKTENDEISYKTCFQFLVFKISETEKWKIENVIVIKQNFSYLFIWEVVLNEINRSLNPIQYQLDQIGFKHLIRLDPIEKITIQFILNQMWTN